MYLVELRPGKEELYRTSDELAIAIRNGDVDARSRVYHRATAKWISITLHPQYRAIASTTTEDANPTPRPVRRTWVGMLSGSAEQPLAPAAADPSDPGPLHNWRRPLALGVAALLLISGLQLAFSGPRPPWASQSHRVAIAKDQRNLAGKAESGTPKKSPMLKASPKPALISFSKSRPVEESALADVESRAAKRVPRMLPRAPRLRSMSLRDALAAEPTKLEGSSLEALFARYSAAHDSARARLQTGMRVARLGRLFAASRLSPAGGVTDTRMSLAGAANFIRVYRQQQTAIERAYEDTVTAMARQNGWSPKEVRAWYSRAPLTETPSLELLSTSLLASIDSVFGVLHDEAGAYKIRGTAIAFEEPAAGQKYGALRRKVKEQIDAVVAAGGATSGGPTGLLLQAIGTTSLPRET